MSVCPNINSEEWKELKDRVGEIEAYSLFIKNDYNMPTDAVKPKLTVSDRKDAESLKGLTKSINKIKYDLNSKIAIYDKSGKNEQVNKLKDLVKTLETAESLVAIKTIVASANSFVKQLSKRLENDEVKTTKEIKEIEMYLGSFKDIKDLSQFVKRDKALSEGDKEVILKEIFATSGLITEFYKEYRGKAIDILAEELMVHDTSVRSRYRVRYQSEYQIENPYERSTISRDEYNKNRNAWVDGKLSENEEQIRQDAKDHAIEQLQETTTDIPGLTAMFSDQGGVKSNVIQLAKGLLDRADYNVLQSFTDSRGEIINAHEEFVKGAPNEIVTNQKELYKGIYEEVNGEATGYYVGKIYNSVFNDYSTLTHEFNRSTIEGKEKIDLLKEYMVKYVKKGTHEIGGRAYDNYEKFVSSSLLLDGEFLSGVNKKEITDHILKGKPLSEDTLNNLTIKIKIPQEEDHPVSRNIKSEYLNPQWNALNSDSRKLKMWQSLRDYNKESDKIAGRGRLYYKMPQMHKESLERVGENGIVDASKESIRDTFKNNANDKDKGELETVDGEVRVKANPDGTMVERVNLPYRMNVDIKDLSFDLTGAAMANRHASLNFKEKSEIKETLQVLKDVVGEKTFIKQQNGKTLKSIVRSFGVSQEEMIDIEEKGVNSNEYKMLSSIIEDRLYGRGSIESGEIAGVNLDKMANQMMKWSSNQMLIGNIFGATSNVLQGKVMNFLESVNGRNYNRKQLREAEKDYWGDMKNIMSDVGQIQPKSITNLLLERFVGTAMTSDMFLRSMVDDKTWKRIADTSTLHGLNASAEHYVQATMMYAVMKGMGYSKSDFSVKDGKLVLPKELEKDSKDFEMSVKIKKVIKDSQGNYDPNNKSMIRRYWWGKLGEFLRKWIVPGYQRRWRGIGKGSLEKTGQELIESGETFYSQESERFEEGTYLSAVRFLYNNYKELATFKLSVLKKDWNQLTDMERGNIINATVEFSLMVAGILAANMFASAAEDDDDNPYLFTAAYMFRRMYGELMAYTPLDPGEAIRIMKTPTATMSTIEAATKSLGQVLSDLGPGGQGMFSFEQFESGRRKGEYKSWHYTNKLVNPFYKIFDDEIKYKYDFLTNLN